MLLQSVWEWLSCQFSYSNTLENVFTACGSHIWPKIHLKVTLLSHRHTWFRSLNVRTTTTHSHKSNEVRTLPIAADKEQAKSTSRMQQLRTALHRLYRKHRVHPCIFFRYHFPLQYVLQSTTLVYFLFLQSSLLMKLWHFDWVPLHLSVLYQITFQRRTYVKNVAAQHTTRSGSLEETTWPLIREQLTHLSTVVCVCVFLITVRRMRGSQSLSQLQASCVVNVELLLSCMYLRAK